MGCAWPFGFFDRQVVVAATWFGIACRGPLGRIGGRWSTLGLLRRQAKSVAAGHRMTMLDLHSSLRDEADIDRYVEVASAFLAELFA